MFWMHDHQQDDARDIAAILAELETGGDPPDWLIDALYGGCDNV